MRISDWSSDVCSSDLFPGQVVRSGGMLVGETTSRQKLSPGRPSVNIWVTESCYGILASPYDNEYNSELGTFLALGVNVTPNTFTPELRICVNITTNRRRTSMKPRTFSFLQIIT